MPSTLTERDRKWMRWTDSGSKIFATCSRKQFMAIILDADGFVVSTGYNGVPSGWTHCIDGGCPRGQSGVAHGSGYDNCFSAHAEQNAIIRSDPFRLRDSTLYVNGPPCWECAKFIVAAGITRVVYMDDPDFASHFPRALAYMVDGGVQCELAELDRED